jgi:hypothetical protein
MTYEPLLLHREVLLDGIYLISVTHFQLQLGGNIFSDFDLDLMSLFSDINYIFSY